MVELTPICFSTCCRASCAALKVMLSLGFAWLSLAAMAVGQDTESTGDPARPYADGPLRRADFAQKPPADLGGLLAWTYADIRHNYNYRVNPQAGRWQAFPTDLTFTAIIVPNRCWNVDFENANLLLHEQGHFDITEIHARQAENAFASKLADTALWGSGATREAAVDALAANMKKLVAPMRDDFWSEQKRYDAETQNGRNLQAQQEWSRLIAERLKGNESGGTRETSGTADNPDILALLRQAADGKGAKRREALTALARQSPKYKQTRHQLAGIWQLAQSRDSEVASAARRQVANAFERAPVGACLQWLANDDEALDRLIWKKLDARIGRADKARLAQYRQSARKALDDQSAEPGTRDAARKLLAKLDKVAAGG